MELGDRRSVPEKVIDKWTYKVKDVEIEFLDYVPEKERTHADEKTKLTRERVKNKVVNVELRMVKTTVQSEEAPHPLQSVKLIAYCPELKTKMEGTDVEALRAAMWSMLDEHFAIKWERYYLVKVDQQRVYSGTGTALAVSYDDVYKGTTHDGKVLMRIWRYRDNRIELWPGVFKEANGNVIACIPATEANKLALEEFIRRTNILREKLQEFLKPERIEQTLANLAGFNLLPALHEQSNERTAEDVELGG